MISAEMAHELAVKQSVCVRPLLRRVTDRQTGNVEEVPIPCGSTRESVCPSCADKARRLRMQQRAEGWHLEEDPLDPAISDQAFEDPADAGDDEDGAAVSDGQTAASDRRVRSTRRRGDVVDLPRKLMEDRTVGKVFTSPDGRRYRPSMFVTLTLGSYGRVISARKDRHVHGAGAPVDPCGYDYRRAALEALHFPKLFDRWVQNLRRCAGFRVQYFGAIEPQRRLAPHIHVAMRGAISRQIIRQVTTATYLQLWWPRHDRPVYVDQMPTWDPVGECYRDPQTGERLPNWEEALDALEEDPAAREPSVMMRFGAQADIKGIIAPSRDADRAVRYLTKYLTKAVSQTYTDPEHVDAAHEAHIDRLHAEVLYLPCTPECPNWLRFGVEPKNPGPGMRPGWCSSRVHDRENLGLGGRRVQVSRAWSGKTLSEHKADRATVVREVLEAAGVEVPPADRLSAARPDSDGEPRFVWEDLPVGAADYVRVVASSVQQAQRWRRQYEEAKEQQGMGARASPEPGRRACGQSFGNQCPEAEAKCDTARAEPGLPAIERRELGGDAD